ncbi:MAG TPA: RNB domain-containing ribonuclease [Thermoleophilaceae bacterium]|jgi:exoribonuclease R
MTRRPIRLSPADAAAPLFEAIRREADVTAAFPPAVEAEAEAAARVPVAGERSELPFVTIDPPGSRDLDQALHIERRGAGHRVSYAIADVAAFVGPGGALDRDVHERGVTVYAPDAKVPLHPPVLSEGAASLLPGEWRPAVLWTLDLDATGELVAAAVARRLVRSVAQHTYEDVPPELEPLLREVGERRLAIERERGGVRLAVPEQEVEREGDSWTLRYRVPLPSEEHNAQVSLLTGMAAADLMLRAGVGILRTQPEPEARAVERLREQARALRVEWPAGLSYPEFVRTLDPAVPAHAAVMHEATGVGHGAGYTAFDGAPPEEPEHFAIAAPYAHATAPLRRLQDRYVSECCLAAAAGGPVPDWVRAGLPELPGAMAAADKRARAVERAVVDVVEALLLQGREGERFEAVVIDEGTVQLRDPAVRGKLDGDCPSVGTELTVRLERADPATRTVEFSPASG